MERISTVALEYAALAYAFLQRPDVLVQFGILIVFYLVAHLLARRLEPLLEIQARKIKGMPGLLRVVVAFLRRFNWLFFFILLTVAYVISILIGWPASNYIIYSAMLLSGAWLLISIISYSIRSLALRKLFAYLAWLYVAALILGAVDDVAALLDGAGFGVGNVRVSALSIMQAVLVIGTMLWLGFSAGNFIDRRIQRVDELTPSLRVLLGKIVRISLIVLAALIAISGIGLDLTALTVLSGAVGVGIGFGLQKVVSNFISGIIILMDQSIKPGDTITLGETFGWIRELRARFVSVITRDGREFLIPNEDFITREVINWSFSDKFVRLDVDFGVSYDADPHEVIRLAIAATAAVGRVETSRNQPVCWLTEFGDSSLNFKLRFWISDPQQGLTNIRGQVLIALWDTFKEHGVGIPYPHREVIFKSPLKVDTIQPDSP